MDTVGDGSGTKVATGDYSLSAQDFRLTCQNDEHILLCSRMIVLIQYAGNMASSGYIGATPLANGITVQVRDETDTVVEDFTDGDPVISLAEWAGLCHDMNDYRWGSGTDDLASVRWTFRRMGKPVVLHHGWSIAVNLNDNFSGLVNHKFKIQGDRWVD
jgi:hypothetical protein